MTMELETRRGAWLAAVLFAGLAGCPKTDSPAPVPQDASTAAEGATAIRDAMFAKIADCTMAGAPYLDFMSRRTDDLAPKYQASVDSGRITYHQSYVDRCLGTIAVTTCAQLTPGGDVNGTKLPVCEQVLAGAVLEGGACTWNAECRTGWCRDGGTCPFTCARPLENGSSCSSNEQCLRGACRSGYWVCADGRPGNAGDPCGYGDQPCVLGHFCKLQTTPGVAWVCTAQVGEGQSCASDPECLSGLGCADDGKCRPLAAVGADCSAAACGYGAFCSAAAGTRCVDDPWRVGDGCAEHASCWSGLHCDGSSTCVAGTVAEGGTCDAASDLFCVDGTWCSAGTCTLAASSGTVCP